MAVDVSWETLRQLARSRATSGCAVSVFLDLDPSTAPTAGEAQTRMNSLLDAGARWLDAHRERLSHEARAGLEEDLERIARWFDDEFDRDSAWGLAVFAAGRDGFWRPLSLVRGVPDRIYVGQTFEVAPLAPLIGRGDGALVAVVGRERGELFRLQAGELIEVADLTEEQLGRHDQGGWSQARYQRHIEKQVQEHLKQVAHEVDGWEQGGEKPRVVLVGTDENRAAFADELSEEARQAVVGATQVEAHATAAQIREAILPVLEEARRSDEAAALERWREEWGRRANATAGWPGTLEAASDARVELLLYSPGPPPRRPRRVGFECPKCGRVAADPGDCPLDGTPMEQRDDAYELALRQTLSHGGGALEILYHQDLDPVDGIGAVLRF